jgi:hypothetical protein
MGINARLQVETGDLLGEVLDPQMVLSRAAQRGFVGTRLLKYLQPWGDAVFNQAQADDLHADIVEVMNTNAGTQLFDILSEIKPLVARLSRETHAYLWFVGD